MNELETLREIKKAEGTRSAYGNLGEMVESVLGDKDAALIFIGTPTSGKTYCVNNIVKYAAQKGKRLVVSNWEKGGEGRARSSGKLLTPVGQPLDENGLAVSNYFTADSLRQALTDNLHVIGELPVTAARIERVIRGRNLGYSPALEDLMLRRGMFESIGKRRIAVAALEGGPILRTVTMEKRDALKTARTDEELIEAARVFGVKYSSLEELRDLSKDGASKPEIRVVLNAVNDAISHLDFRQIKSVPNADLLLENLLQEIKGFEPNPHEPDVFTDDELPKEDDENGDITNIGEVGLWQYVLEEYLGVSQENMIIARNRPWVSQLGIPSIAEMLKYINRKKRGLDFLT